MEEQMRNDEMEIDLIELFHVQFAGMITRFCVWSLVL